PPPALARAPRLLPPNRSPSDHRTTTACRPFPPPGQTKSAIGPPTLWCNGDRRQPPLLFCLVPLANALICSNRFSLVILNAENSKICNSYTSSPPPIPL